MILTPPPEKFFATINDIPDETTATINELLIDIDARQFFNTVVTTLNKYSIGSNNHRIVPSINETTFKTNKRNEQQTTIEGQIKCLIEDLTDYWKNDQTIGWQKLIRNFILGFEMHSYYENIVSKKSNKKNKRKNASDTNESNSVKPKEWDFVKKNVEIYSKCINTIMKSNQIIDVINKTAKDLNPDTEDYNFQNAVREITSKIKDSMKFSYLLYYFVLMFGYVALISPPTTDQAKLLKYLKLKDFNEIIEKFNHLKSKPLGKDIIQANNVHGKNILNVILNCAKRLNVNNEKLKNGLIMINNNYLFRVYSDPVKNSNNKSTKKARLAFNAFGTDTESAASSSTNNSRNDRWRRNGNQRQNELEHYKSQFEALQNELLHYPLEEYNSEYDSRNMIGRHEAQHAVSNIYGVQLEDYSFGGEFNPDQKSDMHNKIVTIINGLNQETIEEINNAANHMIQNEMAHSAITDFRENITDQQKKIYDDTVELLKSKSDENPYLRFRSELDIDLILGNKAIELCTNG
ncbi:unnamed protein product [Rhizophagus irregularis]|uniref:Uncharacterized protein n=1 Tax=Rhizophagus irregularis TaxID=588596 RepID=A0A915Z3H5_9GLOM|nr:unnamed protein product [Rhizophagus irregularis]